MPLFAWRIGSGGGVGNRLMARIIENWSVSLSSSTSAEWKAPQNCVLVECAISLGFYHSATDAFYAMLSKTSSPVSDVWNQTTILAVDGRLNGAGQGTNSNSRICNIPIAIGQSIFAILNFSAGNSRAFFQMSVVYEY